MVELGWCHDLVSRSKQESTLSDYSLWRSSSASMNVSHSDCSDAVAHMNESFCVKKMSHATHDANTSRADVKWCDGRVYVCLCV